MPESSKTDEARKTGTEMYLKYYKQWDRAIDILRIIVIAVFIIAYLRKGLL